MNFEKHNDELLKLLAKEDALTSREEALKILKKSDQLTHTHDQK